MDFINIIVIDKDDYKIVKNILIHANLPSIAEQRFIEECSEQFTNWDEYSAGDIENIIMDGYEESSHRMVCMSWPDVGK